MKAVAVAAKKKLNDKHLQHKVKHEQIAIYIGIVIVCKSI